MPQLIEHIDAIVRKEGRHVPWLMFLDDHRELLGSDIANAGVTGDFQQPNAVDNSRH